MPASTSDLGWRIGGTLAGVALAAVTSIWEAVLTGWFVVIGGHVIRLPVAPLLAVVVNVTLVWFMLQVTRRVGLTLLPALAWVVVMFAAGGLTSDGDLIVEGNWVGLTTILFGAVSWAIGGWFLVSRFRDRQAVGPAPAPAVAARISQTAGVSRAGATAPRAAAKPSARPTAKPGAGPTAKPSAGPAAGSGGRGKGKRVKRRP